MAYQGQSFDIRVGRGGLLTDDSPSDIPDTHLIRAINVDIQNGSIKKEPGSRKWNLSALGTGIIALLDWFPSELLQRFIVVGRDGKTYKYSDRETVSEITPASAASPTTLILSPQIQVSMCTGGQETISAARKIFIFCGNSQVQVISGDASTRANISTPAADWTMTNGYPRGGVVHRDRLWAFMDHRIYASQTSDQEAFTGGTSMQFSVYPGEGERLVSAYVFKGKLFLFKQPYGAYVLVDESADTSDWYFQRVSSEFGGTGPDSQLTVIDDFISTNSVGSITSLKAVQNFGDVESGDVFSLMKVENYMRSLMSVDGLADRKAIYYDEKKIAFFAFRSSGGTNNDRCFRMDFSKQAPQVTVSDKDQINCFALRRIGNHKKPFYGSDDGYIYEMDTEDRLVGASAYTADFQTAHLDMRHVNPQVATMNKNFDALEVSFVPSASSISIDYYIDGVFMETKTLSLVFGPYLNDFVLDTDDLSSPYVVISKKIRLKGYGRAISIRVRNSGSNENFEITNLRVYARVSDDKQKPVDSGR